MRIADKASKAVIREFPEEMLGRLYGYIHANGWMA